MRLLRTLRCALGRHAKGRYCAYCGKLVDNRPMQKYRVRSRLDGSIDVVVAALDEQHAYDLVGHGWHRENLVIELLVTPAPR